MKNYRFIIQALGLLILSISGYLIGCVEASEWACKRSSECPGEQICRIGDCVPGDIYLPAESTSNEQRSGDLRGRDGTADAPPEPACPQGRPPALGELVINEVLANVPTGDAGDANGDGTRDAYDDEFVEVVNRSEDVLDVSGVTLRIGEHNKFYFEEVCMKSLEAAVIFGGGQPAAQPNYQVHVARSRFALGNSGGSVSLLDAKGVQIDAMSYGESPPVSLNLSPEVEGSEYVAHTELNPDLIFSPGTCASGATFAQGCDVEEDEGSDETEDD